MTVRAPSPMLIAVPLKLNADVIAVHTVRLYLGSKLGVKLVEPAVVLKSPNESTVP